jgi:hypothetical protein
MRPGQWVVSAIVDPCVSSEWEISNVHRRRLTQTYKYAVQKGVVSVKEIDHLHHIELGCPNEFNFELKSEEVIKNLMDVRGCGLVVV